jgi:hypothetical protein
LQSLSHNRRFAANAIRRLRGRPSTLIGIVPVVVVGAGFDSVVGVADI